MTFIYLHPKYFRMPKHHSAIEHLEDLHLRADKLKVKALRVKAISDVMKRKARDGDGSAALCWPNDPDQLSGDSNQKPK